MNVGRCVVGSGFQTQPIKMRFCVFALTLAFVYYVDCQVIWQEKFCLCTYQYDPVCASDMRRYRNSCTFDCRKDYLRNNNQPMINDVDCKLLPPTSPFATKF